jgi:serine protease AprX
MNNLFLRVLCAFFSLASVIASGQQVKYWIMLKNKNGTPFAVNAPAAFVTQKSIERRTRYGISFNESDLPVNPGYVSQIDAVSQVRVLFASKWLNGVVVSIDTSLGKNALAEINALPFVGGESKVNRYILRNHEPLPEIGRVSKATGSAASGAYGGSGGQIRQLRLDCLHENGFRGQGMTIAVCDVGFSNTDLISGFDSLRIRGQILGGRDFVSGGTNPYVGGTHGTQVLSCMAAIIPGTVMGTAPMADYWLCRTEEGARETISEEYNWIRAAEFADSVGADIITTSLGYTQFEDPKQNHTHASLDGRTAPMSIASTMAARKGMLVFTAAGNEGGGFWRKISVAGDADSICTVGAVDTVGRRASFSAMGPTADGRIKPDLMACGAGTWIYDGQSYPGSGTSYATPVLAGAAACYWQQYRDRSNMRVLSDLKAMATRAERPDTLVGWGIPRFDCKSEFDFTANVNASTSVITIRLSRGWHNDVKVEMTELSGKTVFLSEISRIDDLLLYNAAPLTQNIYIVKVSSSLGSIARKVVKE